MRSTILLAALALVTSLAPSGAVLAQAQGCPPGTKLAAGACVTSCPAGFSDNGTSCTLTRQGN